MFKGVRNLWDSCVIRREANNCRHWPQCESCILVTLCLIKLPEGWDQQEIDAESEGDREQLSMLILSHITGRCGTYCLFCEVERIPL